MYPLYMYYDVFIRNQKQFDSQASGHLFDAASHMYTTHTHIYICITLVILVYAFVTRR